MNPKYCIRCGIEEKEVHREGSYGCYLYGDKMANRHLYTTDAKQNHLYLNHGPPAHNELV